MADDAQPSIEEIKREIARAAIERENLIVVYVLEGKTTVNVAGTHFTELRGLVAAEAVAEMVADGEAYQRAFNGLGTAHQLTTEGVERFTKDISG